MRLILPFWSGLERTHMAGFLPVMLKTKSSRHSCVMSLRSLPSRRLAHFCFTSGFSFCARTAPDQKKKDKQEKDKQINFRPKRREIGRRRDGQREKEKKKRPIINKSISGRVPPPFDGFTAPVMQQQQHGTCFNLTFLLWRERERVGILRERGLLLICIWERTRFFPSFLLRCGEMIKPTIEDGGPSSLFSHPIVRARYITAMTITGSGEILSAGKRRKRRRLEGKR